MIDDAIVPVNVEITWPDWRRQLVTLTSIDRYVEITYDPTD